MLQQQQQISLVPQPSEVSQPQHPQHKAFVCETCGKAFRFRSNLAEHRSVHTAVKPFVCKFCGKSSRLKGNLTKHILKHHKIEQKEYIGTEDYIIKKGKKSVKDPAAIEFLEKSMIILNNGGNVQQNNGTQYFMQHAPGSNQSADSGGTDHQNGGEFDGQGVLLSLGLDSGSLDLKAEDAMDEGDEDETNFGHFQSPTEETNGVLENNNQQQQNIKQYRQHSTANESLLEHCESAICSGGDTQSAERHSSDTGINESDADGTSAEDGSGAECQSSGNQSPFLPIESAAGTNALAAAACKALLFGQMDSKMLAKTLLGGTRATNICGVMGQQKDSVSSAEGSNQQQTQATNDEIIRILQQVSSLTDQQQQQQQHSQQNEASSAAAASSSKLATQCQLCGKHFRKPRDLIAHLASNAHKFQTTAAPNWAHSTNNGTDPSLLNGTAEQTHGQNIPQQQTQEVIGRLFKDLSPAASLTATTTTTTTKPINYGDDRNHQQHLMANELIELRSIVADLRTTAGGSSKLEQMLGQLDSRVCRLEKQLDMALNSIYTLVQLQTGINNSVQKLASITPNLNRPTLKTEQ